MVDRELQERFARGCTDAAFGYASAATAAYAAFANQVLDFWTSVLTPPQGRTPAPAAWGWPVPARSDPSPPAPFAPFAWPIPARPAPGAGAPFPTWLDMLPFPAPHLAPVWSPVWPSAWPQAWPMAFMLIAWGVPRSVAWPAAEANAAAMDAADAAAASVQRVLASCRTEDGHAFTGQFREPASLMLLAMLLPLNINALLAGLRMG